MRIAVLISTLAQGGAERVVSLLSGAWARAGAEVHVMTYEAEGARPAFAIDPAVTVHRLDLLAPAGGAGAAAKLMLNLQRMRRIRGMVRRLAPDVLVVFTTENNIQGLAATRALGLPVVISERSHPVAFEIGRVRRWARRLLYPLADAVVVQSQSLAVALEREVGRKLLLTVIGNPIDLAPIETAKASMGDRPRETTVVALGRLTPEKGHDDLIAAFARIAHRFPNWRLEIHGEGAQRAYLESCRERAGAAAARILMPGATDRPAELLVKAGILAHPSHYEGAPNTIIEGLAAGCAIIATDAPGATRELLQDGRYGVLVRPRDVEGLAEGLAALLGDPERRASLSSTARDAVARLDLVTVAQTWLELLRGTI